MDNKNPVPPYHANAFSCVYSLPRPIKVFLVLITESSITFGAGTKRSLVLLIINVFDDSKNSDLIPLRSLASYDALWLNQVRCNCEVGFCMFVLYPRHLVFCSSCCHSICLS
jgi:hypothetical protein